MEFHAMDQFCATGTEQHPTALLASGLDRKQKKEGRKRGQKKGDRFIFRRKINLSPFLSFPNLPRLLGVIMAHPERFELPTP
jgi:hypothetical protein